MFRSGRDGEASAQLEALTPRTPHRSLETFSYSAADEKKERAALFDPVIREMERVLIATINLGINCKIMSNYSKNLFSLLHNKSQRLNFTVVN